MTISMPSEAFLRNETNLILFLSVFRMLIIPLIDVLVISFKRLNFNLIFF